MALLAFIVAFGFAVEAALGFGATLVTVALGAWLLPVPELLPMFLPLGLGLSGWIVWRERDAVDLRLLGREVGPWMGLGLPLGQLGVQVLPPRLLTAALGALVTSAACRELWVAWRGLPRREPPAALAKSVLVLGGAAHGAFGTGGPFVVWLLGRRSLDKRVFRATLSGLWLALNSALLLLWLIEGRLGSESLRGTVVLALGAAIGGWVGNHLFSVLPAHRFRQAVFVMLAFAGIALLLRS